MDTIRSFPIGIQDFAKLRESGCLYVDKTEYVYRLASTKSPYFLGRPRRFGKSLFLSTLRYYFEGRKELFEGLAIAGLEKEWKKHPVIYLDFVNGSYNSTHSLEKAIRQQLCQHEQQWGFTSDEDDVALRFNTLIRNAAMQSGTQVVVLVDEYDKPLLDTPDIKMQDEMRRVLKPFYGVLKGSDQYLRFAMLTGVTRFSKVSIFSDLNQLRDISMDEFYAGICGISEAELRATFTPDVEALAARRNMSTDKAFAELKKRYDGYRFSKDVAIGMYNPFSLINTFEKRDFSYYWFATGTSTFLVKMIQNADLDLCQIGKSEMTISAQSITDYRTENEDPLPLLYQSGYLTIKGYDSMLDEYLLGFPNEEVKYGFLNELLPIYMNLKGSMQQNFDARQFTKDLLAGNVEAFMARIRAFFSHIPYKLSDRTERHYQAMFFVLFTLIGQFVRAEVESAAGRADAVVETRDTVFVFEFKLAARASAEEALKQIDDKGYLIPYSASGKKLVKIGAEFDATTRTVSRWVAA